MLEIKKDDKEVQHDQNVEEIQKKSHQRSIAFHFTQSMTTSLKPKPQKGRWIEIACVKDKKMTEIFFLSHTKIAPKSTFLAQNPIRTQLPFSSPPLNSSLPNLFTTA